MGFVVRLVLVFGKFTIIVVLLALIVVATVWLLNKLTQFVADQLGVEVTDFFVWLRSKLRKKNKNAEKETDNVR